MNSEAGPFTSLVELRAVQARLGERRRHESDDPGKCISHLRGLFRRANQRFVEVDKLLLRTCEELRQVGDTLDSVLKVIDEQ